MFAVNDLKDFVALCKQNPKVLSLPQLSFFKDWLIALGAKVPVPTSDAKESAEESEEEEEASYTKTAGGDANKEYKPQAEEVLLVLLFSFTEGESDPSCTIFCCPAVPHSADE